MACRCQPRGQPAKREIMGNPSQEQSAEPGSWHLGFLLPGVNQVRSLTPQV
jgi:hypothetical protein